MDMYLCVSTMVRKALLYTIIGTVFRINLSIVGSLKPIVSINVHSLDQVVMKGWCKLVICMWVNEVKRYCCSDECIFAKRDKLILLSSVLSSLGSKKKKL